MSNVFKERTLAVTRLVLMILAVINSVLVTQGVSPIPVNEDAVLTWVTHGVDAVVLIYCGWWKDNNITRKTIKKKAGGE